MSELRRDATTDEWVIIASERGARPWQGPRTAPAATGDTRADCPFCPGREHRSTEIERCPAAPGEGWSLRVVVNAFPAFVPQAPAQALALPQPFTAQAGHGHHEVVVETPHHDRPFWAYDTAEVLRVLQAWQRRYRVLRRAPGVRSVLCLRNQGHQAGASLTHPHSQILAPPVVPQRIARKQAAARRYARRSARRPGQHPGGPAAATLYAALLAAEREDGRRILHEGQGLVTLLPYASRWPYETWVLPDGRPPRFEALSADDLAAVAAACRDVVRRIHAVEGPFPFNLVLNTPAVGTRGAARFPWHLELLPRLVVPGGFELGSDTIINPLPPEQAARRLRAAQDA